MSGGKRDTLTRILGFTSSVELATALALMLVPALVGKFLLGVEADNTAELFGRCFGVSLLALSLACWPDRKTAGNNRQGVRGMLTYNALIAAYLAYLGMTTHLVGVLLWPAVLLHAVVALLLCVDRVSRDQVATL